MLIIRGIMGMLMNMVRAKQYTQFKIKKIGKTYFEKEFTGGTIKLNEAI
jgi:hypothetical protein